MPKPHGLTKRGNVYYIRRRVPKELKVMIGKDEICRSLGRLNTIYGGPLIFYPHRALTLNL